MCVMAPADGPMQPICPLASTLGHSLHCSRLVCCCCCCRCFRRRASSSSSDPALCRGPGAVAAAAGPPTRQMAPTATAAAAATASPLSASHADGSTGSNTLLAGLVCTGNIHLVVGANPLAASRCNQSIAAGALPILVAPETAELHYGLQARVDDKSVRWEKKSFEDSDLFTLGRPDVGGVVDAVFVTSGPRDGLATHIAQLCKRSRIPVNVVDAPHLCSFTLLSVHTDGPLQVGVTTNGRGCKLASRIRREIASSLPRGLGPACARLGEVRRRIQDDDALALGDLDDSLGQGALFNRLVAEEDVRNRRMRWLSQVCEYWPLGKLASVGDDDVDRLLAAYAGLGAASPQRGQCPRIPRSAASRKLCGSVTAGGAVFAEPVIPCI